MAGTPMNIYTPGAGILDTHVTWEDIERNMQSALDTKSTFGPKKSVRNVGEGNGFLSRICLIEPDWQCKTAEETLPDKFVAKLCTCVALISFSQAQAECEEHLKEVFENNIKLIKNLEKDIKEFHNNESDVFLLAKKYGVSDRIKQPKVYYVQKFTTEEPLKGHIVMDFMDNLHTVHIIDNLPVEAMKQPLRALAVLEATSLRFTDEERGRFKTLPLKEIFEKIIGGDAVDQYTKPLRGFSEGKLNDICDKVEATVSEIRRCEQYDILPVKLGLRPVLIHGDLWSTNLLWKKEGEKYELAAMIDYQNCHFGAPGWDLCRVLNANLSGKDRREHWEHLLETFYGYVLGELKGTPAPYTLEQLKLAYEMFIPMGVYLIMMNIGPFSDSAIKNREESEKEKIKNVVNEKARCLLEDMLFYYDKHYKSN